MNRLRDMLSTIVCILRIDSKNRMTCHLTDIREMKRKHGTYFFNLTIL
jgi:hypothetical protein